MTGPVNVNESLLDAPNCKLGLVGEIADFIYKSAPHPNRTIALAGALAWMAGVTGRSYNTWTGSGCNLYLLLIAGTGIGKEAATSGRSKLDAAIQKLASLNSHDPTKSSVGTFNGPTLVSAAGTMKALEQKPSMSVNFPEAGYKFKSMSGSRVSPNDEALKALLLDLYGKSGQGSLFRHNAYSDRDKNAKGDTFSPALTIFAESAPGPIYEALDERMISSGLLPRFLVLEASEPRSSLVENPNPCPHSALVTVANDLVATSLGYNGLNNALPVRATSEAMAVFRQFDEFVTGEINSKSGDATKELYNRAWLNAQKVACILAIGIHHYDPVVTEQQACWATNMVVSSVKAIIRKFQTDEVGSVDGNETQQVKLLIRAISHYMVSPWDKVSGYQGGVTEEMHKGYIITESYLSRYLSPRPAFKNDRLGATKAVKRSIDSLLNSDEIKELPQSQLQSMFGRAPRSFIVAIPERFAASVV
jgi:hypothetical protein